MALERDLPREIQRDLEAQLSRQLAPASVGIDLASVADIERSLADFGERFVERLFSDAEAAYAAESPGLRAERLAARFAAKEAAIKAFGWSEASVDWREIEVVRAGDGGCRLALHGKAARLAAGAGCVSTLVSLTHDGLRAAAVVVVLKGSGSPPDARVGKPSHTEPQQDD